MNVRYKAILPLLVVVEPSLSSRSSNVMGCGSVALTVVIIVYECEEGSFDSAVDGCDGVFHTACSEYFSANDPKADIVDTAVKGTLNVLKSCAKASSIKRVIYTSSTAAVMCNKKPLTPDTVVDETWFLDPVVCEETKNWYALSKTLAEDATWNSQKRMELTWVEDDKPIEQTYQVSRAKAESLGISNFISWEVSLQDTIESLKKKGFLSF
ncbi:hypothetical protein ACOSQ2_019258 [Xanthoceras sorbifolium]